MTCCRLWFSSTITMTCGCPGRLGVGVGVGVGAGVGVGVGVGAGTSTGLRAGVRTGLDVGLAAAAEPPEEAPAAGRREDPHPALATSNTSDTPTIQIRIP